MVGGQAVNAGFGLPEELQGQLGAGIAPDQRGRYLGGVKGQGGELLPVEEIAVGVQQNHRAVLIVVDQLLGVDHVVLQYPGDLAVAANHIIGLILLLVIETALCAIKITESAVFPQFLGEF